MGLHHTTNGVIEPGRRATMTAREPADIRPPTGSMTQLTPTLWLLLMLDLLGTALMTLAILATWGGEGFAGLNAALQAWVPLPQPGYWLLGLGVLLTLPFALMILLRAGSARSTQGAS